MFEITWSKEKFPSFTGSEEFRLFAYDPEEDKGIELGTMTDLKYNGDVLEGVYIGHTPLSASSTVTQAVITLRSGSELVGNV